MKLPSSQSISDLSVCDEFDTDERKQLPNKHERPVQKTYGPTLSVRRKPHAVKAVESSNKKEGKGKKSNMRHGGRRGNHNALNHVFGIELDQSVLSSFANPNEQCTDSTTLAFNN